MWRAASGVWWNSDQDGRVHSEALGDRLLPQTTRILVAAPGRHLQSMVSHVLRGAGCRDILHVLTASTLLQTLDQARPRIVVMTADFPHLSGVVLTQKVRAGFNFVPRETAIILMTAAPTRSFLEQTRAVGVDEVLAIPFTAQALSARVRAVFDRPRSFVDCAAYVGPCRRRLMLQDYKGPRRRTEDPVMPAGTPTEFWSQQTGRAAVRLCVQKMSDYRAGLAPDVHAQLRDIYASVMRVDTRLQQEGDAALADAARRFGVFLSELGPGCAPDPDQVRHHVGILHRLALASVASAGAATPGKPPQ